MDGRTHVFLSPVFIPGGGGTGGEGTPSVGDSSMVTAFFIIFVVEGMAAPQ